MKKKLLVVSILCAFGLAACGKGGSSLSSVDLSFEEGKTYSSFLNAKETYELSLKVHEAAKRFKGGVGKVETMMYIPPENVGDGYTQYKSINTNDIVIYSNNMTSAKTESQVTYQEGTVTRTINTSQETYEFYKLNKSFVRFTRSSHELIPTYDVSSVENVNEHFASVVNNKFAVFSIDEDINDLEVPFAKVGSDYEWTDSTWVENVNYVTAGNEKVAVRTISKRQEVVRFNSNGELVRHTTYTASLSNKHPVTGEYLNEMVLVSESKIVLTARYGDKELGQLPNELNGNIFIKAVHVTGFEADVDDVTAVLSTDFAETGLGSLKDINKVTSGNGAMIIEAGGNALNGVKTSAVFEAELIVFNAEGYLEKQCSQVQNLDFTVKGVPVYSTSDHTANFVMAEKPTEYVFTFDFVLNANSTTEAPSVSFTNIVLTNVVD